MAVDLPAAYVGMKSIKTASEYAFRPDRNGLWGVLSALVESRAKVRLERELRLTIALVLKHLPAGTCLITSDGHDGREWSIGPAGPVMIRRLREAA